LQLHVGREQIGSPLFYGKFEGFMRLLQCFCYLLLPGYIPERTDEKVLTFYFNLVPYDGNRYPLTIAGDYDRGYRFPS